VAFLKPKNIDK